MESSGFLKRHRSLIFCFWQVEVGTDGLLDLHREAKKIDRDVDESTLPEVEEPWRPDIDSKQPIDFALYRSLKMKEDALIAQREREVLEGELLDRNQVLHEYGNAFYTCKTRLLTIPSSVAGIVAAETDASICKEIIEGSVREALAELGAASARFGSAGPDEASTEADSLAVG